MKFFLILLIVVCSLNYYKFVVTASNSASASNNELASLNLPQFKNIFLTFMNNLLPVYIDLVNDIDEKVTEFRRMIGIQEFLSLGSLYGQYIQMYSIWKQQYDQLSVSLTNLMNEPAQNETTIIFSNNALQSFIQSLTVFSNGCTFALGGTIQTINAFIDATLDSSFTYNADNFTLPNSLVQLIIKSLSNMSKGNEQLISGAETFKSILNSTLAKQNNNDASVFIENTITFKSVLQYNLKQIEVTSKNLRNSFKTGIKSANSTMYTGNINATNNLFNAAQSKTALYYNNVIGSGYSYVMQIVSTMY